jgi:hypothetical protein
MSVSSLSSPSVPPQPPPQQPAVQTEANKPQTQQTQTTQTADFQVNETGDDAAAEKQASRPPLPPGQGTRVDILA